MSSPELLVGDIAPKIQVSRFLKGATLDSFEKGSVYVVEFWATWCGPCLQTMPHLTALQATYPEVGILGVAVMETKPDQLDAFVADHADLMGYTVAEDLADEGLGGVMHAQWCQAAYLPGIPAAFIVDRDGRIAWSGHPLTIDDALAAVVADTWDIQAAAETHRRTLEADMTREIKALNAAVDLARKAGDLPAALKACDGAFAEHPGLEAKMCLLKVTLLAQMDKGGLLAYSDRVRGFDLGSAEGHRSVAIAFFAAASASETPFDAAIAHTALTLLRRAETLILAGAEPNPFFVATIESGLGEVLLYLGESEKALCAALAAEEWIGKVDAPFMVERIGGLITRCRHVASAIAAPAPRDVCDGDTCRLD